MCEYVFDKKQTISCLISRWSRQIRLCKRCWRECFYISTNTYVKIALMKNKKCILSEMSALQPQQQCTFRFLLFRVKNRSYVILIM